MALAIACAGIFMWSDGACRELLFYDRVSGAAGYGCMAIGYRSYPPGNWGAPMYERRMGPMYYCHTSLLQYHHVGAWRPFHLTTYDKEGRHHVVIPLWQPFALSIGIVFFSHGYLVGLRRGDRSRCAKCGYDLTGAGRSSGEAKCPECGTQAVS